MHRCLLAALLFTATLHTQRPASIVGQEAPRWEVSEWFQLPTGKKSLGTSDFKDKVVYLYCFQSWCPGCHSHGFPTLQKLVRKFQKRDDVAFVAVQTVFEGFQTNTLARARQVARRYRLGIPFGHDDGQGKGSRIMRAYRTGGTPWTIVIDKDGVVRYSDFTIEVQKAEKLLDGLAAAKRDDRNPLIGKRLGSLAGLRWLTPNKRMPELARHELTLFRWWTSPCPHCKASLPDLWKLTRSHKGLGMVAVFHEKSGKKLSDEEVSARARRIGYGGSIGIDPDVTELATLMKRGGLHRATSVSLLVDAKGTVLWVHPGPRIHRSSKSMFRRADAAWRELEALVSRRLGARNPGPASRKSRKRARK